MRSQKLNRQGVKDIYQNQMCKLDDEQLQANVGTSGEPLRVSLLKVKLIPSTPALWLLGEKEYCFSRQGGNLLAA